MKKPFSSLISLIVVFAVSTFVPISESKSPSKRAESPHATEQISRVEAGLLPPTVIKGDPAPLMKLTDRLQFHKVPGVSIAVINEGRIDWARAYGLKNIETKKPVTADTLFQAGSISKPVAALAALKLVELGKLNLDEDVNHKLNSWKVPENEFTKDQKVTLRRLLTHSAGLTVHGFPGYAADQPIPSLVQILNGEKPANTAAIRVDTVPGTVWRYSGGGYTVLQQLLVDVLKKPFPQIMRELVLDPAGMKNSTYDNPPPSTRAHQVSDAHVAGAGVKGRFHVYPEMAAAGLWTTPTDLGLLAIELQKSLAGKSNKILSSQMSKEMLSPQFQRWGLGPAVTVRNGTIEFSHAGSDEGFEAYWVAFNDGRGAVVMTNGDRGNALAMEIIRAISREYKWNAYQPVERTLAAVNPKVYDDYVGDYEFRINPTLTVLFTFSVEGGKLFAQRNGGAKRQWLPSSPTDFFSLSSENTLHFARDNQGRVTEVTIHQGGEIYRGRRIK